MPEAKFRKGQLVRVIPAPNPVMRSDAAVTRLTQAERHEMGLLPYYNEPGDDGESRLVPYFTHLQPIVGSLLTVIRGRAAMPIEAYRRRRSGYVLAFSTTMGRELWIHGSCLESLEEQESQ